MSTKDKVRFRRRLAQAAAVLAALALVLLGVVGAGANGFADERSDAVEKKAAQQQRISELRDDLEGIDQEIADLIIKVEEAAAAVEVAEANLAAAEEELAAAERHHDQVKAELESARAEVDELDEQIVESSETEGELTNAVGDMARDLYRGGSTSPLDVVMQTEDLRDVNARSAAATSLSRVQSRALSEVREGLVVKENHMARQQAVVERVETLEQEAAAAQAEAEAARDAVQENLGALEASLAEQQSAQAQWEANRDTALAQLDSAQAAKVQADAAIQRIDRENFQKQQVFDTQQQQTSSSSSSSSSSGGTSAPTQAAPRPSGGAMFVNPFRFAMRITSPFGYRVHPVLGYTLFHAGTDLGAACGTSQYATRAGVVAYTGYDSGLGNYVRINHGLINGSSYVTEHGHLSQILVSPGQQVSTSTVVGLTGTTGRSTGCHLHLGLMQNGSYVNIMNYM